MASTIHAAFKNGNDGIRAARELLAIGLGADDVGLLLPDQHAEHHANPGLAPHAGDHAGATVLNTEEGIGIGALLGLLTALCVPGIGMFVGSAAIVAGLLSGGASFGGIAGGIYGFMIEHGVPHDTAKAVSDNLGKGGTTLRAYAPNAAMEAEVARIIERTGGNLISRDDRP
jgi:hypothetical protein